MEKPMNVMNAFAIIAAGDGNSVYMTNAAGAVKMTPEEMEAATHKELNIKRNLGDLVRYTGWKHKTFAAVTGVSPAQLSKYINPGREDVPSLDYLIKLCEFAPFKAMGITLDVLAGDVFHPIAMQEKKQEDPHADGAVAESDEIGGNYIGYCFDHAEIKRASGAESSLSLRYSVISIYKDYDNISGEAVLRATAAFFETYEFERARELKQNLDRIFRTAGSFNARIDRLETAFTTARTALYDGTVSFAGEHVYVHVCGRACGDMAEIILYADRKGAKGDYIGGLGGMVSVSSGEGGVPVAQRVILSAYELNGSDELIASHLSVPTPDLSKYSEAAEVAAFCRELYNSDSFLYSLTEEDKIVMIRRRLDLLAGKYTERHIFSIGSVTREANEAVCALIRKSVD